MWGGDGCIVRGGKVLTLDTMSHTKGLRRGEAGMGVESLNYISYLHMTLCMLWSIELIYTLYFINSRNSLGFLYNNNNNKICISSDKDDQKDKLCLDPARNDLKPFVGLAFKLEVSISYNLLIIIFIIHFHNVIFIFILIISMI